MTAAIDGALLLVGLCGHAALWIGLVNRIHSTGMPRSCVKWLSHLCLAAVFVVPLCLAGVAWFNRSEADSGVGFLSSFWAASRYYLWPCIALWALVVAAWIRRKARFQPAIALKSSRAEHIDIANELGFAPVRGRLANLCRRIPYNQIFQLSIEQREFEFTRLPLALDGLSIVHLSDFHFTGRFAKEFFQEVVRRANELQPDIVAITGDLVDHACYIDWLPDTVGRLRAKLGVYFILGNHDIRTRDVARVRRALTDQGCIDLGGRWLAMGVRGETIVLAGNELPWIAPAADMRTCVSAAVGMERDRPFRVLLSHSPDQFEWAQRWDFDLMLAGHTHGGQFCIPWIGPVLTPCWHGVKYSSGSFRESNTLLHVSRGICGEIPLRWNCRPELGKIVLRSSSARPWAGLTTADRSAGCPLPVAS